MRLDKFLKVSRIIKRRTIANQACDSEKIVVNNKIAKASLNLKVGDVIVLSLDEIAEKKNSSSMYKIIAEENNG